MLSGISFKIIHVGGGVRGTGASRDAGKLATLFVIVEADEDGLRDSLHYSYYLCLKLFKTRANICLEELLRSSPAQCLVQY